MLSLMETFRKLGYLRIKAPFNQFQYIWPNILPLLKKSDLGSKKDLLDACVKNAEI